MIIVCCDHAGFELKEAFIEQKTLDEFDSNIRDLSLEYNPNDDYPIIVAGVVEYISANNIKDVNIIAICGSGEGMCIGFNRISGYRGGVGYSVETAKGLRNHNHANVLCLPARHAIIDSYEDILSAFFSTPYSQEQRHIRRVHQLDNLF